VNEKEQLAKGLEEETKILTLSILLTKTREVVQK
jgi:hypothetical protein